MSWKPQDIVAEAINVYLDYHASGAGEEIIWSRKAEYVPLPRAENKACHDSGMINKVSRMSEDSPILPIISRILANLPVGQHNAILARHYYVGLHFPTNETKWQDAKAYTDSDRARKVGQSLDEFDRNRKAGEAAIFRELRK